MFVSRPTFRRLPLFATDLALSHYASSRFVSGNTNPFLALCLALSRISPSSRFVSGIVTQLLLALCLALLHSFFFSLCVWHCQSVWHCHTTPSSRSVSGIVTISLFSLCVLHCHPTPRFVSGIVNVSGIVTQFPLLALCLALSHAYLLSLFIWHCHTSIPLLALCLAFSHIYTSSRFVSGILRVCCIVTQFPLYCQTAPSRFVSGNVLHGSIASLSVRPGLL